MNIFQRIFGMGNSQKITNTINGVRIGGDYVGGNSYSRNVNMNDGDIQLEAGGSITLNGVTYSGKNITIRDGSILIDGKQVDDNGLRDINITVDGDVKSIMLSTCNLCTITGDVGSIKISSGDISITGDCDGSIVSSSGDIEVGGDVSGSIKTSSGDVTCGGR